MTATPRDSRAGGRFQLRLQPQGRVVPVAGSQSLLDAVLAAGIPAPHSCTMGYCGSCRAELRAGIVEYPSGQRVDASDQSSRPDDIMMCIARPRSDLEVRIRFPERTGALDAT